MSSEVISRLISELKPHPRNYNNHSDRQVDDLALSLKRFGQRKPIVTWRDMIVAGHGLTMAAQMAGWTSILTMPIPDDWDEATVLAYLAADNELARQADPDLAQLAAITKELEGIDEELAKLAAGGDDALKALMATIEDEKPNGDAEPQIDKAEELRVKWNVQSGQMWQLGEHRIVCGDCTDRAVVERVMGGEKASLLLNDPPYGMRLDADFSGMVNPDFVQEKGTKNGRKYSNVIGDHVDYDAAPIVSIFSDVKEQLWWGADYYSATLGDTMHEGSWIVWDKRLDESMDKMYGSCFELLWSRQKHKRDILRIKWAGIWGTEHEPQRGRMHPNQKPVRLYEELLNRYTESGDIVVDCYSGSGTTLIACQNLSRKCRAVEISPAYVAVAIQRWVDATGKEPILL